MIKVRRCRRMHPPHWWFLFFLRLDHGSDIRMIHLLFTLQLRLVEFQSIYNMIATTSVVAAATTSTSSPNTIVREPFWHRHWSRKQPQQRRDRRGMWMKEYNHTNHTDTDLWNADDPDDVTGRPNGISAQHVEDTRHRSQHPIPPDATADTVDTNMGRRSATVAAIVTAVPNWFLRHPPHVPSFMTTGLLQQLLRRTLQYGIGVYLILELCRAIQTTMEEMNESNDLNHDDANDDDEGEEHHDHSASSSSRPSSTAAFRQYPHLIREIIQHLQQTEQRLSPMEEKKNKTSPSKRSSRSDSSTSTSSATYQSIYTLAQWLHSAGIPYYSDSHKNKSDSTDATSLSVESLLMELTHTEIALLQQCLYVLPNTNSENRHSSRERPPNFIRRNLIGLESIHGQIVDTIQNALGRNNPSKGGNSSTSNTTINNPFESLFHDVVASSPSNTERKDTKNNIGILLYGPPGCGKTNLIRTLVQSLQLPCLIITPSILLRKYVGETNLHIRTLFHMVQNKMSPCILCIDELDGLFRERQADYNEHEVNRELKTEFLQWMDGMMTTTSTENRKGPKNPMIIIGATNRPFDVDAAILRRLSHTYYVGLPNASQRRELFVQFLQPIPNTIITTPTNHPSSSHLPEIVALTAGYTPSDLRQLLQIAAISGPMKRNSSLMNDPKLSLQDVIQAMSVIGPTPLNSNYEQQMRQFRHERNPANIDRFGYTKLGNSLYMGDENNDETARNDMDPSIDRPFSLAFLDRHQMEHSDDHHPSSDRWETIFGNFYDIGTLEIDETTLDLLVQYIRQVVEQSDDNDNNSINNDSDNSNSDSNNKNGD